MITYSETADALYVQLEDAAVARTTPLDDLRIVDYSADGSIVGVEFLAASEGLVLRDLPERARLESLILKLQFPLVA